MWSFRICNVERNEFPCLCGYCTKCTRKKRESYRKNDEINRRKYRYFQQFEEVPTHIHAQQSNVFERFFHHWFHSVWLIYCVSLPFFILQKDKTKRWNITENKWVFFLNFIILYLAVVVLTEWNCMNGITNRCRFKINKLIMNIRCRFRSSIFHTKTMKKKWRDNIPWWKRIAPKLNAIYLLIYLEIYGAISSITRMKGDNFGQHLIWLRSFLFCIQAQGSLAHLRFVTVCGDVVMCQCRWMLLSSI